MSGPEATDVGARGAGPVRHPGTRFPASRTCSGVSSQSAALALASSCAWLVTAVNTEHTRPGQQPRDCQIADTAAVIRRPSVQPLHRLQAVVPQIDERVKQYLRPTIFWQLTAAQNDVIRAATRDIRAFIDESVTTFILGTKPLEE